MYSKDEIELVYSSIIQSFTFINNTNYTSLFDETEYIKFGKITKIILLIIVKKL